MTDCTLGRELRSDREPRPSEVIVDSQSVETATMVSQAVGYDGAKQIKGRKRYLTVDTLGLQNARAGHSSQSTRA